MSWKTRAVGIAATVLTTGAMVFAAAPAASADPPQVHEGDGGMTDYWWCTGAPNCQYNLCEKGMGCASMPIYTMGPGEPVWASLPFGKSVVLSYSGWYPTSVPGSSTSGWYNPFDSSSSAGGCEPLSRELPCYQQK